MVISNLDQLLEALAEETGDFVSERIGEVRKSLEEQVTTLERRVADLESRVPEYQGVYSAVETYRKGALVTWDGSMWIARATTNHQPGTTDSWQLCVKHGRDARC